MSGLSYWNYVILTNSRDMNALEELHNPVTSKPLSFQNLTITILQGNLIFDIT